MDVEIPDFGIEPEQVDFEPVEIELNPDFEEFLIARYGALGSRVPVARMKYLELRELVHNHLRNNGDE